jgi:hypothetical protein
VRHLNDHKLDNYVWNLAYGTGKANCADRERNASREIYKRFADGDDTAALIAADFGISRSVVAAIGNGTAWQHLGLPPFHRGPQWQRRQRNHRGQFA